MYFKTYFYHFYQSDKALNKPNKTTTTIAVKNLAAVKAAIAGYRPELAAVALARYRFVYPSTTHNHLHNANYNFFLYTLQ